MENENFGFYLASGEKLDRSEAVFPIIKQTKLGFQVCGTGFYICGEGLFLTAAHCFLDANGEVENQVPHFVVNLFPHGDYSILRPIVRMVRHPSADICVGISAGIQNNKTKKAHSVQSLSLTAERPPIGTDIASYNFANSLLSIGDDGKPKLSLAPDFYSGKLVKYHPSARDKNFLRWPCWETSMMMLAGASGGPVIDNRTGKTFAINTSSFEADESVSYVTPIDLALDIRLTDLEVNGIPKSEASISELAELGAISFSPSIMPR